MLYYNYQLELQPTRAVWITLLSFKIYFLAFKKASKEAGSGREKWTF